MSNKFLVTVEGSIIDVTRRHMSKLRRELEEKFHYLDYVVYDSVVQESLVETFRTGDEVEYEYSYRYRFEMDVDYLSACLSEDEKIKALTIRILEEATLEGVAIERLY